MKNTQSATNLLSTYLHEIGRIPLLTPEEEILYSRQMQYLNSLHLAQQLLIAQLSRKPTFEEWARATEITTVTELKELIYRGEAAKRKLIEANLRFVVSIAKKYVKRDVELLDLIQEGTLGLQQAAEKFDSNRGYRFSTYAYWWIRQAITRAISQQSRTIRLPSHITEKLNKIKKTQRLLAQKLGRTPTVYEVAGELELTPEQLQDYLARSRSPVSLEQQLGDSQDTTLVEILEDTATSLEELVMHSFLSNDLKQLMAESLTWQQQQVLILHFGLENGEALPLKQIGNLLHLSRERVRQIEKQALSKLRKDKAKVYDYLIP